MNSTTVLLTIKQNTSQILRYTHYVHHYGNATVVNLDNQNNVSDLKGS